jgi:hypothetical protein
MFSALYVPVRRTQGQALHLFNQVSLTSPSVASRKWLAGVWYNGP